VLECEALALGTDGTLRDARTGTLAGTATARGPLRWLFGRFAPVLLSVREEPDGALVFTVSRGWRWFGRWFEVRDANGAFVGSLVLDRGALCVADRDGKPFAEARVRGDSWSFVTVESELVATGGRVVRPAPRFAADPPAKMLLLASSLVTLLIELPQQPTGSD
jgi:hypothetical protein